MLVIIRLIVVIVLIYEVAAVTDYMIYQLCYQENAYCTKKNLTCPEGFVISVEWSRIAFSEYWVDDGTRSNCTPTSGTCYEEVDEPTINCSNSNSCQLDSCGKNIHTNINCLGNEATNVLQINYTCIEATTPAPTSSSTTSAATTSTTTSTTTLSRISPSTQSPTSSTPSTVTSRTTPTAHSAATTTSETNTTEPSTNGLTLTEKIAIGVVTIVVIIVLVIIIVIALKRSKNKVEPEPDNGPTDEREAENEKDIERQDGTGTASRTDDGSSDNDEFVSEAGTLPAISDVGEDENLSQPEFNNNTSSAAAENTTKPWIAQSGLTESVNDDGTSFNGKPDTPDENTDRSHSAVQSVDETRPDESVAGEGSRSQDMTHSKCLIARDTEAIGLFFEKRERPETKMETPAEDNMTIVDID